MKDEPKGRLPEHRNVGLFQSIFFTKYTCYTPICRKIPPSCVFRHFYDLKTAAPTILRNKRKEFASAHRSSYMSTLTSKNYGTAVVFLPSFLLCEVML